MRVHPAGPAHGRAAHEAPHAAARPPTSTRSTPPSGRSGVDAVGRRRPDGARPRRPRPGRRARHPGLLARRGRPAAAVPRLPRGVRRRARSSTPPRRSSAGAVARWVEEEGLGLDVCTGGELAVAVQAGFPGERLLLHGNNKSTAELSAALDAGRRPRRRRLLRRDRRGWPSCAPTAASPSGCWCARPSASRRTPTSSSRPRTRTRSSASRSPAARPRGGTPRARRARARAGRGCTRTSARRSSTPSGFEVAAHRVVGLLAAVRDEHGVELPELNLGGGLGIAYTSADDPADVVAMGRVAAPTSSTRECAASGLRRPALAVEPGRAHRRPGHGHGLRGRHRQAGRRGCGPSSRSTAA